MRPQRRWVLVAAGCGAAAELRLVSRGHAADVVSVNPFLLISEWFNAEWEHRLSPTTTAGVRVSRVDLGDPDVSYFSGRGFWRYYPNGAYEEFFFGFDAGVTGLDDSGDARTVLGAPSSRSRRTA